MADIKVKEKSNMKIKKFDKAMVYSQRLKDNVVNIKEKANYENQEENYGTEYGANCVEERTRYGVRKGTEKFNKYGQRSLKETKENINKAKEKVKNIKKKFVDKKIKNKSKKIIQKTGKNAKRTIKTAKNTGKVAYKTAPKTTKVTAKTAKKAYQIAKATAKQTIKGIKLAIKTTIAIIKAIIIATKALILTIVAGGWIAVIIIIVICLIAMLVGSIFGVFFSSEDIGSSITVDGIQQPVTMNKVISDLNIEFMNKVTQIQKDNPYNEYDITGNRAEWKDILAIYVAKVSNGNNQVEMMTLNDEKVNSLKQIFWEMNEITFTTDVETKEETIIHLTWTEHRTVIYTKLHITINSKSINEMANKYNFSQEQRNQLTELSSEQYASMWSAVIYGSSVGSNDIVKVALEQVGNVGGQTYWSWYGFESRVEWCACFVSWCANQCRLY